MARSVLRPLMTSFSSTAITVPDFLIPCVARVRPGQPMQVYSFSTTSAQQYPRDRNKLRGMSAMRGTGLRQPLSVSKLPLPKPQLDADKRSQPETDPAHGLWGFFNKDKTAVNTPEEDFAHGRPWTVEELRHKSWEDLHSLWWVCVKERNRIYTSSKERERAKLGYGQFEADARDKTVKKTQKAIKHVLTERWYAWDSARQLAMKDPAVDLTGQGQAYTPYEASNERSR